MNTTFTENAERTRALGVWSAIAAAGGAVGLLLGGVLTDLASWQWIFFVNVPVGVAALALTLRFVPESRTEMAQRAFDLAGAFTVTAGLVVLVYAIVKAQAYGWGSGRTLGLIAAALVLLSAFVLIERRSVAPLMRLSIFRMRTLSGGHGAAAGRLGNVRNVLLRLAVRAGDPRVQPTAGWTRVLAGHRGNRRRRRDRAATDPPAGSAQHRDRRDHAGGSWDGRAHAAPGERKLRG